MARWLRAFVVVFWSLVLAGPNSISEAQREAHSPVDRALATITRPKHGEEVTDVTSTEARCYSPGCGRIRVEGSVTPGWYPHLAVKPVSTGPIRIQRQIDSLTDDGTFITYAELPGNSGREFSLCIIATRGNYKYREGTILQQMRLSQNSNDELRSDVVTITLKD
jgi:hypothetical protein